MADLEGRTLGRYELRQLVGRGGMADVYQAFDSAFQRVVAVKVFKRDDEELLRRFVREARLMASLNNPHLMPVYDTGVGEVDGLPYYYIVMPFMEGGSLRARIRRSPIPLHVACRYMRAIADALDYIHAQGIVHRDIKASNVLLDAEDNCYLSDFGIAHMNSDVTQLTSTGNVLGTVDYVAPELFEPHHRADASTDLYSLGVLLFEMATGQLPFSAENQIAVAAMHVNKLPPLPHSLVPRISPAVERVILKGLEKRSEFRYGSATQFANAFCQAITMPNVANTVERVATPRWSKADNGQDEPLILPSVPSAPVAAPSNGRQQGSIPAAPYMRSTNGYSSAPLNSQIPKYQRQQQSLRRPTSSASTRARIVTVLALLTLLAIIGPIVYVLLDHPVAGNAPSPSGQTQAAITGSTTPPTPGQTPSPTLNSTATTQASATATQPTPNATATAIVSGTGTAQAHLTATAGVIRTATAGTVLYQDTLTNPDNASTQSAQWKQNGNCTFDAQGYHVTKGTTLFGSGQLQGCREASNQYQNMAISVDMDILSGHSGGLFFRVGTKTFGAYSGYLFEVDSTGRYKISRSADFTTGSGNATLQNWTASSALKTGSTVKNTLQVIANGSNLSFYANGAFLVTLQDTNFTSGTIALLATTSNNGANADIVYSNLSVYALS